MSESDSDDDNSLASVPRSSTGGSPPNGSNTALKKNNSTRRLFGRRKSKTDSITPTESGLESNDGSRRNSIVVTRRRGLFRRRRTSSSPPERTAHSDTESHSRLVNADRIQRGSRTGTLSLKKPSSGGGGAGGIWSAAGTGFDSTNSSIVRSGSNVKGSWGASASSKDLLSYPAPQPLHRIRSTGAAEDGGGLSQDPDFFPPIPLAENGEGTERPSARGEVRYGDYIRLWGYSTYSNKAGYVGYLRRTTKKRNSVGKGELFVLPPVPSSPSSIFHESCFKIVDPQSEKEDGDVLRFGEEISLVDDRGMVWNNKDGRLHGRLGPSLFGNGGHMQLKFLKKIDPSSENKEAASSSSSPEPPTKGGGGTEGIRGSSKEGPAAIKYGDTCELIAKKIRPRREGVIRAPVTHFRRRHQIQLGGYLRSDGKGTTCAFTIHHSPPRISMVSVYSFSADGTVTDTHTHYKIPWNQELEFELPPENSSGREGHGSGEAESPSDDDENGLPVLRVTLSNGGEMALRGRDVKSCEGKPAWFDVVGLPEPAAVLASTRLKWEGTGEDKDKKIVSIEVLSLGAVLVTFSLVKALAARAPRLFMSWELPMVFEVLLDALISVLMVIVVCRHKGMPAMILQRPERSNSAKHVIKLMKCESGASQGKPVGDASEEEVDGFPPMPDTFLLAEFGDHDKAYARWKATVQWREESGANVALATPHPRFDVVKKHYPTFFHGKDKSGAVLYYEQLGQIDDEALRRSGLDAKQLLWHYMYQMEYLWSVINPNDADRATIVLDLKGVTLATCSKAEIIGFIKQAVTMMSTHYPERSNGVLLISWPRWFDWIFRFIRPLLSESTKSKITAASAANVYQTLLSKIDNDQIPKEYGGASEYALGDHPWEVGMRENAVKVLQEHSMEMEVETDP